MFVVLGFIAYLQKSAPGTSTQGIFFTLLLLAGGCIFASTVFAQFGERRRATVALLLPASHLEKYLVAWLYSLPLFLLAFIPMFYLADAAVVYAAAAPGQTPELLNIFASRQGMTNVLWFLLMLNAAWLCGAIYFEKGHFIKTGFAVFVVMGVLSALNHQVLKALIGADVRIAPPFTSVMMIQNQQFYKIGLPEAQGHWLAWVPLGLTTLLWLASYFRLTEKQI
jgi:hypothetical protein